MNAVVNSKRDELLARKIEIDEKLANARIDIAEAHRVGGRDVPATTEDDGNGT